MLHQEKIAAIAAIAVVCTAANAGVVGFRETFVGGTSNWRSATGAADLAWSASDGAMDAAFVTSTLNLSNTTAGDIHQAVFSAHTSYNSSNCGFAGAWITENVTTVSFRFRHTLSESIRVTARFAPESDAPGAVVATSTLIAADTWTTITFDVTRDSSDIISYEGARYAACFSNVQGLQIGFMVSNTLAGQNVNGSFSVTDFSIVPAPAASALLLAFGAVGRRRRR